MPTILELFKQANGNGDVTVWDGTTQKSGIVDRVNDFASAELNPNGPRMMFYKQLITPPLIYGLDAPRISLKGAVDPARTLSVNSSKYQDTKSTSGKITIGSLLGGSANRPSDIIFKDKTGAPITKGTLGGGPGDYVGLRNSVENGTSYYVSQFPAGKSPFAGVLKGDLNSIGANVAGATINAAKNLIQAGVSKVIKKSRNQDANQEIKTNEEKPKITPTNSKWEYNKPTNFIDNHKNESTNVAKNYTKWYRGENGKLVEREQQFYNAGVSKIDSINGEILTYLVSKRKNQPVTDDSIKDIKSIENVPYVRFKLHQSDADGNNILLPGTISGITEDVSPEWSSFKFIGSPFNQYRYLGVERSISFDMKLYATTRLEMVSMTKNVYRLRKLVYPDENISAIQYPNSNRYSPIVFNGNLVRLTVNGFYYDVFGFIESLNISIDDSTSWVGDSVLSPSVINVSIGFKVIDEVEVDEQTLNFKF
jgi:hypothetical protein